MSNELLPQILEAVRRRTPARLFRGRAGGSYPTAMQLELRAAHAAARDAVRSEFNLEQHLGKELVRRCGLFEVTSAAHNKDEYILRPDLGRQLSEQSRHAVAKRCTGDCDIQFIIGDGLSTCAVANQVSALLPKLMDAIEHRGWTTGTPFAVRYCRVGILNDVGDLLHPGVAILLIGERPGLATAESLSAYMTFRPHSGQTDADRNLISNIHSRGISLQEAAVRIVNLAEKMMRCRLSGTQMREDAPERLGRSGERQLRDESRPE